MVVTSRVYSCLQALQKSSADVRDNMQKNQPPRAASTPPVPGPRAVASDIAPSALAHSGDMRKRPKSSVPKGVAQDFKIRPQTAIQPLQHDEYAASVPARKNRPFSAADGLMMGGLSNEGLSNDAAAGAKQFQAATQPARRHGQWPERMRPMSAADQPSPVPRLHPPQFDCLLSLLSCSSALEVTPLPKVLPN